VAERGEPSEVAVEGCDLRAVFDGDGAEDGIGHEGAADVGLLAQAPQ
jgi:hypothetical protein